MTIHHRIHRLLSIILVLTMANIPGSIVYAGTTNSKQSDTTQETAIKTAIDTYINLKYLGLKTLNVQDYSQIVQTSTEGQAFLKAELDKQAIEIYHAYQFQLQYVKYQYTLDYQQIIIDSTTNTATVSVNEGHDVVFKVTDPTVSSMRNLRHTIKLAFQNGKWLIISDFYEDYLQKIMEFKGSDKDGLIQQIDNSLKGSGVATVATSVPQSTPIPTALPTATKSSELYNRSGAVVYAHQWAFSHNPAYVNFNDLGGDCTNFVSQAMYEGSAVPETVSSGTVGGRGWFYTSATERAASWTDVGSLYDFMVNGHYWVGGPEGKAAAKPEELEQGDIIQYEWGDGGVWNHSVMVVQVVSTSYTSRYPLIAGHSDDMDFYPFAALVYDQVRFIHVTGY